MRDHARVAGVGIVPFATPRKSKPYDVMAEGAVRAALADAGLDYSFIQQAYAGYVYGDSTCGQKSLYRVGMSGVPIVNVNNNCASGSSALWIARQAIVSGSADCVLAFGFEQMQPGAPRIQWEDRPNVFSRFDDVVRGASGYEDDTPMAVRYFNAAAAEYIEKYNAAPGIFASVAVKARKHAANNPYAVFREALTTEEVLRSSKVSGLLTRLQCCPPTCGAAAVVLCSEDFGRKHGLRTGIAIKAQALTTDRGMSFDGDMMNLVGCDMVQRAAARVYEDAGVGPEDISVVELHDCFTVNEVLTYEALELTPEGTSEKFIADGDNTYGGRVVTNPSGGLLSKGHPLGATGLAQCAELVLQLRGHAGPRQVEEAKLALQHNVGLGGAAVVTLYESLA